MSSVPSQAEGSGGTLLHRARPRTLAGHLLLAVLPAIAIFLACNLLWVVPQEQETLRRERQQRAQAMAGLVAMECVLPLETYDMALLQSNVNQAYLQEDVEMVEVVDRDGRVQAADNPLRDGQAAPPLEAGEDRVVASAPIHSGEHDLGTVRVGLSSRSSSHSATFARRQGFLLAILMVLVMVVPTRLAARRLSAPLQRMARSAEALAEGDAASRVQARGHDALAGLAECLNEGAEHVERQIAGQRASRTALIERIRDLADSAAAVAAGTCESQPDATGSDELGAVAHRLHDLVDQLRHQVEREYSARSMLARSSQALAAAHARLSVMDRTRTDFLVVVSHELRTPLTSIKAFAELMRDDMDDGGAVQLEFAQIMLREADRLTRLVNHLLDLSRIEAGRMDWRREKVAAATLARNAAEMAGPAAREREVVLQVQGADARKIECDSERVAQALAHLVDNAVNASRAGDTVTIVLVDDPDHVHFRVDDCGPGIEDRYRDAIFERFWQIRPEQQSGDERPRGSGLGLPLARAIAEAHGGRIDVESTVGQGSSFHLLLPFQSTPQRGSARAIARLQPATQRLLGAPVDAGQWRHMVERLLRGEETPPA